MAEEKAESGTAAWNADDCFRCERRITHGLGAALGGLISAQLEEVERAHRRALAAREAEVREQVARDIEAIDREGVHAYDALLFVEGANVARGLRRRASDGGGIDA